MAFEKLAKILDPTPLETATPLDIAHVIADYREAMDEIQGELRIIQAILDECEEWFVQYFQKTGTQSLKTDFMTVSLTSRLVPRVTDWGAVEEWALENRDLAVFQRRLSVTHLRELEQEDNLPPGVAIDEILQIQVRRKAAATETTEE